ncbi:MAG: hypothetical protein H8F28_12800 [Fibrella sp.]|nr:hypothetical protein [Armatimonadota bacterium]
MLTRLLTNRTPLAAGLLTATVSLFVAAAAAPSASAQGLSYRFLTVDGTNLEQFTSVYGATAGYAAGNARGTATGGSEFSFAWRLSDNTRTELDHTGLFQTEVLSAGSGFAVGDGRFNVGGELQVRAYAWNMADFSRVDLDSAGLTFSSANGAGSGHAVGRGNVPSGAQQAFAWRLSDNTRVALDSSGLSSSSADGATDGFAVGGGDDRAYAWRLSDGARTELNSAGLTSSFAFSAGNGYAVGNGSPAGGGARQLFAWRLSDNSRVTLDTSSLGNPYVVGVAGNYAVGHDRLVNRSYAWNLQSGVRSDLNSLFMPAEVTGSRARGGDPEAGTITGNYNANSKGFALVVFDPTVAQTVNSGETASTTEAVTQASGVAVINGEFRLIGGSDSDTYRLTGGTLGGSGTLSGNLAITGGTLAPGNPLGLFRITDDFALTGGTLAVELAGLSNGQFDAVNVSGVASLTGGALSVALVGFAPTAGDSWDILSAAGGVSSLSGVTVPTGYALSVSGNTVRLQFVGVVTVPEPGTGILALLAAVPLAVRVVSRRRP